MNMNVSAMPIWELEKHMKFFYERGDIPQFERKWDHKTQRFVDMLYIRRLEVLK